jgi:hypothetical protein
MTQTSSTHDLLFGSWLAQTRDLQNEFYGFDLPFDIEDKTEELIDYVRVNVLAAEDELHEALNEVSWKPWASAQFINREEFIGEIVDTLHFIGNLLAGVGCTDAELTEAYLEKMNRNRARMTEGYTGLDKCFECKRSADDVISHGGFMVPFSDTVRLCNKCATEKE